MPLDAEESPREKFETGYKSPETKRIYVLTFDKFLSDNKITFDEFAKSKPAAVEYALKKHCIKLKNDGISYSYRNIFLCSAKRAAKACKTAMHIDWDALFAELGDKKYDRSDKAYTTEELRKMLDAANTRKAAIIHIYAASGIRAAALCIMKLKDMEK